MFNRIKSMAFAATAGTLVLASAATATEMPAISEIEVTASYDAAEDTNAQQMFPEITSDIKLAIAERVPQSDNAADPIIRVDIRKVALDGDTIIPDSAEFNELEGIVSIESESGAGGQTFPVNITAVTGQSAVPEGYVVIAPSTDDFYAAMVMGFAQNVAEGVENLNIQGGSVNR